MGNPLDVLLIPPPESDSPTFRWATVVSTWPLQVRLDGESVALASEPDALAQVDVGDRVLVALNRRRIIVLGGSAPGPEFPGLDGDLVRVTDPLPSCGNTTNVGDNPDSWCEADASSGTTSVETDDVYAPGTQSIKCVTSPSSQSALRSPVLDVTPGETYLARFRGKRTSTESNTYFRIAAGSDDNLTEWPAYSPSTYLTPDTAAYEGRVLDDEWTWHQVVFTAPTGITKAALRVLEYQPSSESTIYLGGFELHRLTGPDAWEGDTGWIEPALLNGWVNYGGSGSYGTARIRRVGTVVHTQGLVKDGTSGYVFTYPSGFYPGVTKIYPAISNSAFARINNLSTGTLQAVNYNNSWVSIEIPPFPVST